MSGNRTGTQCDLLTRAERQRGHHHRPGPQTRPAPARRHDRQRNSHRGVQAAEHQVRRPRLARVVPAAPSQGWGTQAQILDPVHATNAFYDALVKINGYQSIPIAQVAQDVQHSGFPQAYAGHEQEGRILASTLSGVSPGGFGCRLDAATVSTPAATIAAQLTAELGVPATVEAGSVHVTGHDPQQAWAAGSWAVAHADTQGIAAVTVGDRTWTRARGEDAWSWHAASTPIASTAVTIARH